MDSNNTGRTSHSSTAYILGLPNELLSFIFTFLFHSTDAYVSIGRDDTNTTERTILVQPILVMRWVCSRFRQVASRHTIWLDGAYSDLNALFAIGSRYSFQRIEMKQDYMAVLLKDDELCSILRQKSAWRFTTSGTFLAVTGRQPSLVSGARTVSFEDSDMKLLAVMGNLNAFSSLRDLSICFKLDMNVKIHCFLDLDIITRGCPLLEDIYLAKFEHFGGSLAPLQHVQTLSIHARQAEYVDDICYLIPLLPLASAQCFTRLLFWAPMNLEGHMTPTANPLEPFTQLSSFNFDERHSKIYDFVAEAKFSLCDLTIKSYGDIDADGPESMAFLRMLSSPSLKYVKKLTFQDLCTSFEASHIYVMANLEHLEHLEIDAILKQDSWFLLAGGGRLRCLSAYWRDFGAAKHSANNLEAFKSKVKNFGGFSRVVDRKVGWSASNHSLSFFVE